MNNEWVQLNEGSELKFRVENGYVQFEKYPGFIIEEEAVKSLKDLADMVLGGEVFERHTCIKDNITDEDIENSPGIVIDAEHSPNTVYLVDTEYDDAMGILIMTIYVYVEGVQTSKAEFDWFDEIEPLIVKLN